MNEHESSKKNREKNNKEYFLLLNKNLINMLSSLLETPTKLLDTEYDHPTVWTSVLNHLKGLIDHYEKKKNKLSELAEIQLGLAKYFDYFSLKWMTQQDQENLNELVTKIIFLSLKLIQPTWGHYLLCGKHEDGACWRGPLGHRFIPTGNLIINGWPILPFKDAINFLFIPKNIILPAGTELVRVIKENKNTPRGNWWILGNLPQTRKKWRSDYAVLEVWNPDDNYVYFELERSLPVWSGYAASQRVSEKGKFLPCILKGGGEQIWLDPQHLPLNLPIQKVPNSF